ncbi:MAG: U32 family peptidase [Spirochaetaceae bacterium]|nr:U32 family peptidase [Spirochaetaceae bacterium]
MKPPELLAPAGSVEALDAAVGEGADAVYLGLKSFNARLRSANFAYSQFEAALRALHRMGRKLYVTVNTVFEEREAGRIYQLLKYLASAGPDAVIVQDLGVIKMLRDCFPRLKVHASTQMSIASAPGVNTLSREGVSRVVLARELSGEEIRELRSQTTAELEVFVHGALCVSASGLCLFSSYLGGKSANRGLCTQACRRYYRREDEGGYYFSPADLELAADIPALADMGVNSFKIEGRMKSAEYVGAVVAAYRKILDGLNGDRERSIAEARRILQNDFARSKTRFHFGPPGGLAAWDGSAAPPDEAAVPGEVTAAGEAAAPGRLAAWDGAAPPEQRAWPEDPALPDWLDPAQDGGVGIALGSLLRVQGAGEGRRGLVAGSFPHLKAGDSVRLHRADDSERKAHKLSAAEYGQQGCWISIPEGFEPGDSAYLIQQRGSGRRYAPVIREDLGKFRRVPGWDPAPEPSFPAPAAVQGGRQALARALPEGIYVAVSRIADLFVVQADRPVRVILSLNAETAAYLLDEGRPPLPFSRREILLSLDPWFPQGEAARLKEQVSRLEALGYKGYVLNNPGHFALFRARPAAAGAGPLLMGGPYLYTFNRWAAAFAASLGASALVSPLENNRQNLERTAAPQRRPFTLVTLYARPALFRIPADLSAYGFGAFSDSQGEGFHLLSGEGYSQVFPEKPFSIVDKRPFLEQAGFRRFIVDLCGPPLKKKDYRRLMEAVKEARPLSGVSRFNWKDGFYSPDASPAKPPIIDKTLRKAGK